MVNIHLPEPSMCVAGKVKSLLYLNIQSSQATFLFVLFSATLNSGSVLRDNSWVGVGTLCKAVNRFQLATGKANALPSVLCL